ncbi:MAG: hypothetical protein HGB26_01375 [Desulfobulbaceae bacterium]|nr:hypothetical protein [Desulfobulbaceae bacterium]
MPSYLTLKNSLKKLESQQLETDNRQFCGVVTQEAYDKLEFPAAPAGGNNRHIGYLIVPRRLSESEWNGKHGG